MSGSTRVSRYQKGKTKKVKTNLDLLEQETVSGSGICWAICKSAPHADNHANIPPLIFFTGRMPFLTPNQQRQSTEVTSHQTPKIKHVHVLVLIWEQLQMPMTTPTMPDATVQPFGWHTTNKTMLNCHIWSCTMEIVIYRLISTLCTVRFLVSIHLLSM